MSNVFKMTEEEKKKILEKHKDATKNHYVKKDETKKGLQQPDKPENKKLSSQNKNALIAERQKFTDFEMRTLHPNQILKIKETNLFISNLNCLHNLGAKFA